MQKLRLSLVAAVVVLLSTCGLGQGAPVRPRITGISHVGYFVSDLGKALNFWHDLLGFDEMYTLNKPGSEEVRIAFVKINDHQHIELFNEPPPAPPSMLSHICFTVDDVEAMRTYLRSQGIAVKPGNGSRTRTGDDAFEIKDPDGTLVEFVQTLASGMEAKAAGKFEPASRIATKIYHLGFLVGNSQRSLDFYGKVLGFRETWRGTRNPLQLSWINMQVPDGTDYVEFMLYDKLPATYGTQNHISLAVPDITKAVAELQSRPAARTYSREMKIATGVNQKRQVNLYDPDGTRVELMEENTITGKPTPSSTAPPPPPSHD